LEWRCRGAEPTTERMQTSRRGLTSTGITLC